MNRAASFHATSEAGLAAQIVLQLVCGLLLSHWYVSTPDGAHAAATSIREAAFPRFIAGVHYWGGQLLMLHAALHVAAMVWTGSYRGAWTVRWYLAVGVCLCAFALMVTGNLLPFDRHGVQSAVTEIGIANQVPLVGPLASDAMLHGQQFGGNTLAAWYGAHHWILPAILLALFAASYFFRAFEEGVRKSAFGMCVPPAIAVIAGIALRAPIGAGATIADYGRFDAQVNWYAWPMHSAVKAFEAMNSGAGWVGSALLPAAFVLFLVALPRLCDKVTPMFVKATFAFIVAVFAVFGILFGGAPASLLNRDYVLSEQEKLPDVALSAPIDLALVDRGQRLFAKVGCAKCHGAEGIGGLSGPALSHIGRKRQDVKWLKQWIHAPDSQKSGATMPGFADLGDQQLAAIAEYLRSRR